MRLIDADALKYKLIRELNKTGKYTPYECGLDDALSYVNEQPTIEAEPVKHGRWKNRAHLNDHLWAECSNCGFQQENYKVVKLGSSSGDYVGVRWHYCPNCGAKMDGGNNND